MDFGITISGSLFVADALLQISTVKRCLSILNTGADISSCDKRFLVGSDLKFRPISSVLYTLRWVHRRNYIFEFLKIFSSCIVVCWQFLTSYTSLVVSCLMPFLFFHQSKKHQLAENDRSPFSTFSWSDFYLIVGLWS